MKVTADFLIDRRKRQWNVHKNIKKDEKFVLGVAYEIGNNKLLRQEISEKPEKLIELCFTVVDKDKKVVPFFLNVISKQLSPQLYMSVIISSTKSFSMLLLSTILNAVNEFLAISIAFFSVYLQLF